MMKKSWFHRARFVVLLALVGFVTFYLAGLESSRIRATFAKTGLDENASGFVMSSFRTNLATVLVSVRGLDKETAYSLQVGGSNALDFTTTRAGSAVVRFSTNPKGSVNELTFDPRGKTLSIDGAGGAVLQLVFSGVGEPERITIDEQTNLRPTEAAGEKAKGTVRYTVSPSGRRLLYFRVLGLEAGDYDIKIGGFSRATLTTTSRGSGMVRFSTITRGRDVALNFDPRGELIEIVQGATTFFNAIMRAQIPFPGLETCVESTRQQSLTATGPVPNTTATATLTSREDCGRHFAVRTTGLPPGDYDLFIGGLRKSGITSALVGKAEFGGRNSEFHSPVPIPLSNSIVPKIALFDGFKGGNEFDPKIGTAKDGESRGVKSTETNF